MNIENKKISILLIDDKQENAEAIKRHLDKRMRLPWELVHCFTLKEAESRFNKADIIILELVLSGFKSPEEIFRVVQGKVIETPIIALTGKGDKEHGLATYVMEAGAADVIIRGRFNQLIDAIEFALIRQDIATNKRQQSDDTLKNSKESDATERVSEKGEQDNRHEKSRQTLRMFMGDYSVDQSGNKKE